MRDQIGIKSLQFAISGVQLPGFVIQIHLVSIRKTFRTFVWCFNLQLTFIVQLHSFSSLILSLSWRSRFGQSATELNCGLSILWNARLQSRDLDAEWLQMDRFCSYSNWWRDCNACDWDWLQIIRDSLNSLAFHRVKGNSRETLNSQRETYSRKSAEQL